MDLPPESIIKETDCVLGAEVGRGTFGTVSLAVLKGDRSVPVAVPVQACAKVRARSSCCVPCARSDRCVFLAVMFRQCVRMPCDCCYGCALSSG